MSLLERYGYQATDPAMIGSKALIADADAAAARTIIYANTTNSTWIVRISNTSDASVWVSYVLAHASFADCYEIKTAVIDEIHVGPGQTLYGVCDQLTTVTKTVYAYRRPVSY